MDWHNATQALLPTLMESRLKSWGPGDVDMQPDCPFYSGRIPQEITDLIFEFALSPDTLPGPKSQTDPRHDFCIRYDHERADDEPEVGPVSAPQPRPAEPAVTSTSYNPADLYSFDGIASAPFLEIDRRNNLGFDWFRPGDTGRVVHRGLELLRTCRRVYLHTHKISKLSSDTVIYSGREPPWSQGRGWDVNNLIWSLQRNHDATSNRDVDRHAHLVSRLSQGLAPAEPFWQVLHNLEHFHLTIRRTDWDRWEDNKALAINPYRYSHGAPSLEVMRRDMHTAMVEGTQPPYNNMSWITLFRAMRNLKTLNISFETSENKQDEMEEIVAWARTWRFEIMSWRYWVGEHGNEPEAYLVAEDRPARKMSWRGLKHHWSDICPACGSDEASRPDCGHCLRKYKLFKQNKGPRLLVWTLTWRPEPVATQVNSESKEPDN
ncbi:hypothetical protein VMCG_05873 [Cytospora schulzeri]|uniref:Uncharacterized protein n=1 Tax=Cytospora schulzeri TaxID=448051 RepID=A0A423WCZ3_9PEZI|nr:hypothetical protein VMCG_05873 [Valsa malicola]